MGRSSVHFLKQVSRGAIKRCELRIIAFRNFDIERLVQGDDEMMCFSDGSSRHQFATFRSKSCWVVTGTAASPRSIHVRMGSGPKAENIGQNTLPYCRGWAVWRKNRPCG